MLAPATGLEYTNSNYAGYNARNELRVTIDLGERHDKIYKVVMGYLCSTEAGIAPPQSVDVYVSSDGRKYEPVGTMSLPEFEADVRQEGVFECDFYLKARYIRLIAKKQNTWLFVDEISVIANEEETVSEDVKYNEMVKNAYDTLGTISYKPEGEAVSGDYL
ncbi:MAG: discoidin domain-containing protein, partial [Clostridia bacterium]|nr:discoidin domain-containing protein [Clostridia bacterium]